MTETMEIIHGICNITPGAIATTAMLVSVFSLSSTFDYAESLSQAIWCLSGDDTLQQRGATTGIDYLALYEDYLKLIMSGIHHNKVEFISIIQQWDEVVFPGTETSIIGRCRGGEVENEIDKEIERMEDEDNVHCARTEL
jgi:hypothetical protein